MVLTANSFWIPLHLSRSCKSRSHVVGRSLSSLSGNAKRIISYGKKSDENLEVLWDDGYGDQSAEDFFKLAKDFSKIGDDDGGPPRWFCPISCGKPLKDSPLLLYLPGLDCLGLGLLLHEKALGKVFEVRCLHIPVQDRTPFEGVVQFVEEAVRLEHASSPTKPIYVIGDSFGACLAVSVAARNPTLDLGLLPKDTLIWRLKLLKSAAAYANSHLQAVTAQVLVLASYKDQLLPSKDEAQRLSRSLRNCRICILKGNDRQLLLATDNNLLTIIKGSSMYRRTSYHDNIKDYIPPSMSEYTRELEGHRLFHLATNPVMLSTLEDGKVVTGLGGIPSDGPVVFVGHPQMLQLDYEFGIPHVSILLRVFGMLPVSATNFFKLLSAKSYVLLYPGGSREALHRKGEVHKLFWPEKQEFIRMAAKFGATIVPFGSVGEDDVSQMIMDYDEQMNTPGLNNHLRELNEKSILLRQDEEGEVANQPHHLPVVIPKIPGRLYYLFGKPIKTKGMEKILNDKEISQALYAQVKLIVEKNIEYLIKKRDEDPYRGFVKRVAFQAINGTPWDKVPTFDP